MIAWISKLRRYRWEILGRREIRKLVIQKLKKGEPVKIILGSSNNSLTSGEWINTDIPQFDITNAKHWDFIFSEVKIDNLFAEHVLEHLTQNQIEITLSFVKKHLKVGGCFRIAIPDAFNKDKKYQEATRVGGTGPGAFDHKVFLNIDDFKKFAMLFGFNLQPLEYFDERNQFNFTNFDDDNGTVLRSKNRNYSMDDIPAYTSLIVDLIKLEK